MLARKPLTAKPRAAKPPKPKKCRNCRDTFVPIRPLQVACGVPCAIALADKANARKLAEQQKKERAELREKKKSFKRLTDFKKAAQQAFNAFIRERDHADGCISCGRPKHEVERTDGWKVGGAWDAGHFLSVGSHPELRFEESNCHKQCKSCNGGSGQYARKERTVSDEYRARLVAKIGEARVAWLEGPHEPKKYTREELEQIAKHYRAKTRELTKKREGAGCVGAEA